MPSAVCDLEVGEAREAFCWWTARAWSWVGGGRREGRIGDR